MWHVCVYTHTHTHTHTHTRLLLGHQKNKTLPFATIWMELESNMLSAISQSEKDIPYVFTHRWILRNLTEDHGGVEGGKKLQRGREANHKRPLDTENKLNVDGG